MNKNKKVAWRWALFLAIAFSGSAVSAAPGFYALGSVGLTRSDGGFREGTFEGSTNSCLKGTKNCTVDSRDRGFGVGGGWRATEHLGLELYYADFGRPYQLYSSNLNETASQRTTGFGASAVFFWPLTASWTGIGKIGAFSWESKSTYSGVPPSPLNATNRGISPTIGVGFEYSVSEPLAIRLSWDRTVKVGKNAGLLDQVNHRAGTANIDVDQLSVGVVYRFR